MSRFILLLFLTFSALNCSAQIDMLNHTVMRMDSNFVFSEVRNIFTITGAKSVTWQLKARHAQIVHADSPWLFIVESSRLGADTFFLIQNAIIVLTKIFNVIPVPPIVVRWGVLKTDTATTIEVIANRRITVSIPGCNNCPTFRIFGFTIDFITDQLPASNKMIKVYSNMLSETAANLISKLSHGDKVVFSKILAEGADSRIRELPGFTIVIR